MISGSRFLCGRVNAWSALFGAILFGLGLAMLGGCGGSLPPSPASSSVNSSGNLSGVAANLARPFGRSITLVQSQPPQTLSPEASSHLQRTWFVAPRRLKRHELLYVTQWTYGPVLIYDITGGRLARNPVGQINATACDASFDRKGNLYLSLSDQIARYAPGKDKPTLYQPVYPDNAGGTAIANDGTVYLADTQNILVYRHGKTKPSDIIQNPLPPSAFGNILGLAVDASDDVFTPVVIDGASPVYEFQPGSIQGKLLPIYYDWNAVFDEIDPQGDLILSNLGFTNIGGPEPPSIQVYRAGQGEPFATLDTNNYPGRIVLNHNASALFVQDITPGGIFQVDEFAYPSGRLLGTIAPKQGGLTSPYGLAIFPRASL